MAAATALDFVPGGKALKAFKGSATRLGIKKLEKQLAKQAKKRAAKAGRGVKTGTKVPVGSRGKEINVLPNTNSPTVINGRKFTGYSLDRMQGRGFTPSVVEDVIKHPTKILLGNELGTRVYVGEKLKVVLNKAGDVITVIFQ